MNWFAQLTQRLVWAHRAFVADDTNPIIRLDNGISLDLSNNKIILEGNFALHVTGNFSLTADGDLDIRDHVNHHRRSTLVDRLPTDKEVAENEDAQSLMDYFRSKLGFDKEEDGDTSGRGTSKSNV